MAKTKVLTDKEMILDPNAWPNWPLLPLVNRNSSYGDGPNCAVICGDPDDGKVLFIPGANIWQMPDDAVDRGTMRDIDELLHEGWEVD